jgi:hypothetical protein
MKPCVFCLNQTMCRCLECGDAFCNDHETILCPMCVRIKQFKVAYAESHKLVYWQYVEPAQFSTRSQFRGNPSAETLPMPTLRMEVA